MSKLPDAWELVRLPLTARRLLPYVVVGGYVGVPFAILLAVGISIKPDYLSYFWVVLSLNILVLLFTKVIPPFIVRLTKAAFFSLGGKSFAVVLGAVGALITTTLVVVLLPMFRYPWPSFSGAWSARDVAYLTGAMLALEGVVLFGGAALLMFVRLRRTTPARLEDVTIPVFPEHTATDELLQVAHLSDLHVKRDALTKIVGGSELGGNKALSELVGRQAAAAALRKAELIIMTGDMTDAGTCEEWEVLLRDESVFPSEFWQKTILVPGNHEVHVMPSVLRGVISFEFRLETRLRMLRTLLAMSRVQGDRAYLLSPGSDDGQIVTLRDYLAAHEDRISRFISEQPRRIDDVAAGFAFLGAKLTLRRPRRPVRGWTPDDVWRNAFPMAITLKRHDVVVFVLDSNVTAQPKHILENAFGLVPHDATERIQRLHEQLAGPNTGVLIALHHHVVLPDSLQAAIQGAPLVLENAQLFIESVRRLGRFAIFHGHRHYGYHGRLEQKVEIVSAPSTTLGCKRDARGAGFFTYWLGKPPWNGSTQPIIRGLKWYGSKSSGP